MSIEEYFRERLNRPDFKPESPYEMKEARKIWSQLCRFS